MTIITIAHMRTTWINISKHLTQHHYYRSIFIHWGIKTFWHLSKVHLFINCSPDFNRVQHLRLELPMPVLLLETKALCLEADTEWVCKLFQWLPLNYSEWWLHNYLFRMPEWMIFTTLIWMHGSGLNCRYYVRYNYSEKFSKKFSMAFSLFSIISI